MPNEYLLNKSRPEQQLLSISLQSLKGVVLQETLQLLEVDMVHPGEVTLPAQQQEEHLLVQEEPLQGAGVHPQVQGALNLTWVGHQVDMVLVPKGMVLEAGHQLPLVV